MGFRRFLVRSDQAEDLLEQLAELGRAEDPHEQGGYSRTPFAEEATRDGAAPLPPVAVDKKAAQVSAAESKKAEPRRVAYVWRSQASRERRSQAVDFGNTTF